jgi:hypothetical protein
VEVAFAFEGERHLAVFGESVEHLSIAKEERERAREESALFG